MIKRLLLLCLALALPSISYAGPNPIASQSAESCHVWSNAKALIGVSGYVGAAAWIMLFDANSAPADGAVNPVAWAYVPAAGSWSIWYDGQAASFSNGIVVCASSTGPLTKTAYSTNTVFSAQVQ